MAPADQRHALADADRQRVGQLPLDHGLRHPGQGLDAMAEALEVDFQQRGAATDGERPPEVRNRRPAQPIDVELRQL